MRVRRPCTRVGTECRDVLCGSLCLCDIILRQALPVRGNYDPMLYIVVVLFTRKLATGFGADVLLQATELLRVCRPGKRKVMLFSRKHSITIRQFGTEWRHAGCRLSTELGV
jgi:hypothetical protein